MKKALLIVIALNTVFACNEAKVSPRLSSDSILLQDSKKDELKAETEPILLDNDTSLWKELTADDSLLLDLRYATVNNFTDNQIYPCGRCFLRPVIADRILQINRELRAQKKWQLKLFDCYRPRSAQQRLWDIHPNATHVTHPSKGSMHNRGAAVDLTIVTLEGNELDMGTDFDSFDKKARHDFYGLDELILNNRSYLKKIMERKGFKSIKSEWWHYSLSGQGSALSNWEWPCPE